MRSEALNVGCPEQPRFRLERPVAIDELEVAWEHVACGGGATGVDGERLSEVRAHLPQRLAGLSSELASGVYMSSPLRPVKLPAHAGRKERELLIPTVTDRIAQRAILERVTARCNESILPCVHGYRPGRSVHSAVAALRGAVQARPWVLDADIRDCFGSINHDQLRQVLGERIREPGTERLIMEWMAAPVVRKTGLERRARGIPLGAPIAPLVCNLFLQRLDIGLWRPDFTYIRYADDFVVCCAERAQADRARASADEILAAIGLELNLVKTRVVDARAESLVFLGHLVARAGAAGAPTHERPKRRSLYLSQPGSKLTVRGKRLVVKRAGSDPLSVPVREVREVVVLAPTDLTSPAIAACLREGIDISFQSPSGRWWGRLETWRSPNPDLRFLQTLAALAPDRSLAVARPFVLGKIQNQRRLLQRHVARRHGDGLASPLRDMGRMVGVARGAASADALRGAEGFAARSYFKGMSALVAEGWEFSGRVRRPPTDPVNAMLSFLYTVLMGEATTAVAASGLDPHLGFLHANRFGRPSLALDVMEEFRPAIVDMLVLSLLRRGTVAPSGFQRVGGGGVRMDDRTRGLVLREYEDRMLTLFTYEPTGERVSYRRALTLQARQVARVLQDDDLQYRPIRLG